MTMNRDDETFLSAYLDGQLGPDARAGVESALAADPALSDHLRELAVVHELISGLPRPSAPVDLSGAVLAGIASRQRSRPLRLFDDLAPQSLAARAATLIATAAALLAAVTLGLGELHPHGGVNFQVRHVAPPAVDAPPGNEISSATVAKANSGSPAEPTPTHAVASLSPTTAELHREREHAQIRRLLDSPHLKKVFVVNDVIGGEAGKAVGELLEKNERRRPVFARINVSHGFIIDPEHPGKAIVFAAVMDDTELARFEADLGNTVAHFEVKPPRAEVLTQLADVNEVSVLKGRLVAGVRIPESAPSTSPALRADPTSPLTAPSPRLHDPLSGRNVPIAVPEELFVIDRDAPTPEQERSAPHPSVVASKSERDAQPVEAHESSPAPPPEEPRLTVVLVWVATPG